jgi:hypothetical protein
MIFPEDPQDQFRVVRVVLDYEDLDFMDVSHVSSLSLKCGSVGTAK